MKTRKYSELTDLKKVKCANLDWLIRIIEANKKNFGFSNFYEIRSKGGGTASSSPEEVIDHMCGTLACIAGWAGYLAGVNKIYAVNSHTFKVFVGVNQLLAMDICLEPFFYDKANMEDVTAEVAIKELKVLLRQAMKAQNIDLV